ncbi:MAG: class I SAM-dependent methyltransferase [Myxococcales bacterium]|nr:class I SAM-dependent methyltransferase [Myxococcales bacterium]
MSADLDLCALAGATAAIYQRQAARFDAERSRSLRERGWLARLAALVPARGAILDVGCGAGEPIAAHLVQAGFAVTGVDVVDAMLALARARHPTGDWRHADMRSLDLPERFDGIIGWNSFFHLTPEEQRRTLPRLVAHLRPRGALMLTVGHVAGEVTGVVGGERVYHASLAPAEYEAVIAELGLEVVLFTREDPACDHHTVLLARARG